jgi:hypothetical protein
MFAKLRVLRIVERLLEGLAPGVATVERKPGTGAAQVTTARTQAVGKKL